MLAFIFLLQSILGTPHIDDLYHVSVTKRISAAKRLAGTPAAEVSMLDPADLLHCTQAQTIVSRGHCTRQGKAIYHLLNIYAHIASQEILMGTNYQRACSGTPSIGLSHTGCGMFFLQGFLAIGSGGASFVDSLSENAVVDFDVSARAAKKLVEVFNGIGIDEEADVERYAFSNKRWYTMANKRLLVANFFASDMEFRRAAVGHQFIFQNGKRVVHRSSLNIDTLAHTQVETSIGGFELYDEVVPLKSERFWAGFYTLPHGIKRAAIIDTRNLGSRCLVQGKPVNVSQKEFKGSVLSMRILNKQCQLPLGATAAAIENHDL